MWVVAQLESRELLAICLKKLKGLNKVKLVDAGFIWTEPHSRRVKVKLTIQKEAFSNTVLQQIFEVEYVVSSRQCEDCTRVAAQNTWKAVVQVRQKVEHKRTFLYLEQLILKNNAHKDTSNIKEVKDGIDFYFGARNQAIKMVEFLCSVAPMKYKASERLISKDIHTNTSNYKFTYSAEIVPICRDDLVCIPKKLANSLGNIHQLLLCTRVSNSIHFMDVNTLTAVDISTNTYFRNPFQPLSNVKNLTEYYVLDVEPLDQTDGKNILCDVHVARMSDFGRNDEEFITRSHLGAILNPGDAVMGYDLARANFNNDIYDSLSQPPDVVLVRKSYPARKKKSKSRPWRIQQLGKEVDENVLPRKQDQAKNENDMEIFLRDIEEDAEFRSTINIFKNAKSTATVETSEVTEQDDSEDELPEIALEEMLDEMTINVEEDPDYEEVA
ncbi:NMD3-domain-containing protein [Backusella circina FSU 941]|nr:NMD3-domain-containing protein [Backusella circina FSU 941]